MERIITSVTPEELRFAMATGTAAASGRTPQSSVGAYGADVDIPDTPENRAMFAIRSQFDSAKFRALMARIGAMMDVLQDDRAAPYIRRSTEGFKGDEVYEAVVDVAATFPLNGNREFDKGEFFRAVAKAVEGTA
jgi:hypothetical protein